MNSNIDWHTTKLYLNDYSGEIDAASEMYRLESSLVRAVIHAESGFRPLAKSKKGAVGLMQLMPDTARELGVTDARVPSYNIRGGTRYLAGLLMKFRGDIDLAVAAYNAGPMAVESIKGYRRMLRLQPTFNELIYCINATRASVSWLLKYPRPREIACSICLIFRFWSFAF